jgi:hypothetical protein
MFCRIFIARIDADRELPRPRLLEYIIINRDGMPDHPFASLDNKTPLPSAPEGMQKTHVLLGADYAAFKQHLLKHYR